jgi:hypothetical protein
MPDRMPSFGRALGAATVAFGLAGRGLVFSSVAAVTPVSAEGISITVPVVTPVPTPAPTTETPVVVPVGATVATAEFSIALVGLEPFSFVEVYANSEPVLIASGYADGYGEFSAVVKLPPNLPAGDHSITALTVAADGTTKTITVVEFAVLANGRLAKAGSSTSSTTPVPGGIIDEGTVTEEEADTFLASNPLNLSGVFYVGAFESSATYDDGGLLTPGARMSMYINNVHPKNAGGTVRFWVTNPVGLIVAESKPYTIKPLAPGETRLVTSRFSDIGQWGGYTTHLSFTPDKAVSAGIDTPYLRSDTLLVFSWVIATLAVLGSSVLILTRFPALRERILEGMSARFRADER